MSIRDRGTKKWTSLMLPEHVRMLRTYFHEEYYHVSKPVIDEQTIEEWNLILQDAIEEQLLLHIVYHKYQNLHEVSGTIQKVNPYSKTITLCETNGTFVNISFDDLVHVQKI